MNTTRNPEHQAVRIVFFGDSICHGQHVSPHLGWVTRIGAALAAETGIAFRLANPSISGNTTRMALERMPFDVQSHGVDLGYVQFGLNDANHWMTDGGLPRVSPAAFEANLHEILDRMKRFGARRLALASNHPTTRDDAPMAGTDITYEESNRRYNAVIGRVAAQRGDVTLIDHAAAWRAALAGGTPLPSLLLDDGLHLSEAGHDLYFRTAAPAIKRMACELASVTEPA